MQPDLVEHYLSFCRYRKYAEETGQLDLSDAGFLFPTTLLPTANLLRSEAELTPPLSGSVAKYFEAVRKGKATGTMCPIAQIPKDSAKYDEILRNLYRTHLNDGKNCGGANAFKYAVGEMTDNIYQHSDFCNAYVMGQSYPHKHFTDICIIDDGKTIPGVFSEAGIKFSNGCDAITKAISGTSTKLSEGRGMGLGSTLNLIVNGLSGSVLIASGLGAVYVSKKTKLPYDLSPTPELKYNGTLVAFRIPYNSQNVDYTKYIEKRLEV